MHILWILIIRDACLYGVWDMACIGNLNADVIDRNFQQYSVIASYSLLTSGLAHQLITSATMLSIT